MLWPTPHTACRKINCVSLCAIDVAVAAMMTVGVRE
jgi:hypothetical protein